MADSYTQLYLHLVWATWMRAPLLVEPVRSQPDVFGDEALLAEVAKAPRAAQESHKRVGMEGER